MSPTQTGGAGATGFWASAWRDEQFEATRIRQGATAKPDFDTTNLGLLYPQNDPTEVSYIIHQFNHDWKLETDLEPHLHYVQDEATTPVFKIDYRWYKNSEDPTVAFTTLSTADGAGPVFTYTSGSILQILRFPVISGTGFDALSTMMDIKLYRDDNVVTGDVLVKEFDIHAEFDAHGSRERFTK
jgi:hypothetical protein